MFVRRKKNRSGTTSVVVADKSSGKFKELTTIGVSSSPEELDELERKARHWIDHHTGQLSLDFDAAEKARSEYKNMLSNVDRAILNMPQTILSSIYDRIGLNAIDDDILRHLVDRFSLLGGIHHIVSVIVSGHFVREEEQTDFSRLREFSTIDDGFDFS